MPPMLCTRTELLFCEPATNCAPTLASLLELVNGRMLTCRLAADAVAMGWFASSYNDAWIPTVLDRLARLSLVPKVLAACAWPITQAGLPVAAPT